MFHSRRDTRRQWQDSDSRTEMKRETVGRKRKGPRAACPKGAGWGGAPLWRAGWKGLLSHSTIIQESRKARHGNQKCTLQGGSENLDKAGFWLPWACFSLLRKGSPSAVFPASSRYLNEFAPHPSAGSRTGAASELSCTLLSYKTVPPFSPPDYKLGAVVWDLANRQLRSGSKHYPTPGTSPLTLLALNEIG